MKEWFLITLKTLLKLMITFKLLYSKTISLKNKWMLLQMQLTGNSNWAQESLELSGKLVAAQFKKNAINISLSMAMSLLVGRLLSLELET